MTRSVRFSEAATEEFIESADYYQQKAYGLGDAFQDEIYRLSNAAAQRPDSFPTVLDGVRRAVAKRFPFSLYFRVHDDEIFVLAVFHGKRDPTIWEKR